MQTMQWSTRDRSELEHTLESWQRKARGCAVPALLPEALKDKRPTLLLHCADRRTLTGRDRQCSRARVSLPLGRDES